MTYKTLGLVFFVATFLISCQSMDVENPLIGTWEEVSSSSEVVQFGFDRLNTDENPTFLGGSNKNIYTFLEDASFESSLTVFSLAPYVSSGIWKMEGDSIFLEITEPENISIGSNTVFYLQNSKFKSQRFSEPYSALSDAQIEQYSGNSAKLDSLRMCCETLITSVTTSNYEKI